MPDHMWQEWDKGHGRIEYRERRATADITWLQEVHNWLGLTSVAIVHSFRETSKGKHADERYYISLLGANAETIAKAVRSHWGIENSLHWVLM